MARIAGIDIPREKRLEISLTYIFGVGKPTSQKICSDTGLDPNQRVRNMTEAEVDLIRKWIDTNLTVEGDLRREISQDIKRKIEIVVTKASATVRACPSGASALVPTLVAVRVQSEPLPTRRRL